MVVWRRWYGRPLSALTNVARLSIVGHERAPSALNFGSGFVPFPTNETSIARRSDRSVVQSKVPPVGTACPPPGFGWLAPTFQIHSSASSVVASSDGSTFVVVPFTML